MWNLTPDIWHLTPDTWQVKCDALSYIVYFIRFAVSLTIKDRPIHGEILQLIAWIGLGRESMIIWIIPYLTDPANPGCSINTVVLRLSRNQCWLLPSVQVHRPQRLFLDKGHTNLFVKVCCRTPDWPNSPVQPLIGKSGKLYIWVVVRLLFVCRNACRNAGYDRLIPL